MKTAGKKVLIIFVLAVVGIWSWKRIVKINDNYRLTIKKVSMGENVSLQGYETQVEKAQIYTIDQYYETYPQVENFREFDRELYQYVLVATLQITKLSDAASPLDLTNFVLRMENSFNQFEPREMGKLNQWTESQHLKQEESLQVKIPYYISKDFFDEKQLKDLQQIKYRITWGVYPERYEISLNKIENWKETKNEKTKKSMINAEESKESLEKIDTSKMTGAEAYAALLTSKGLTGDNIKASGEQVYVDGVKYQIQSVKQIHNVSEIPEYKEEDQPQPEWMKEGADVPIYTKGDNIHRGEYITKHYYLLVELQMKNEIEKEVAPRMIMTGIAHEATYWKELPWWKGMKIPLNWAERTYSTGGNITYKDSYSSYIVLQPGETKTIYAVYDLFFDIDPTGKNKETENGEPTGLISEEEVKSIEDLQLYFFIDAGLGGEMSFENKGITFVELDWRLKDGTED